MTTKPSTPRWRVTAKGSTSAVANDFHVLWEKGEVRNADAWAETVAPGTNLAFERYGITRPLDGSVSSVRITVTLNAADVAAVEGVTKALLEEALPAVAFSDIAVVSITATFPHDGSSEPSCSFCGRAQSQVTTMIAGTGVYVCGSCVKDMAAMMADDGEG